MNSATVKVLKNFQIQGYTEELLTSFLDLLLTISKMYVLIVSAS